MMRIDRTFRNRLIKWTAVFAVVLEIIMVIINFPDVWEIIEYLGMGAVIIFFVFVTEIQGLAFCIRYGLVKYVDEAEAESKEIIKDAEKTLEKRLEELTDSVSAESTVENNKGLDESETEASNDD